jgi:hypothetical protein
LKKRLNIDDNGNIMLHLFLAIFVGIPTIICSIISYILYTKKKNRLAMIPIIVVFFIIILNVLYIQWYFNQPNEIYYRVSIQTNTTDDYEIFLPVLDNRKLGNKLKMISGEGEFEISEINRTDILTSKNTLKVYSDESVIIERKIEDDNEGEMSLKKAELESGMEHYWVWCNKSNPNQNISFYIDAHVRGVTRGSDWVTEHFYDEIKFQYLEHGWNLIRFEYGVSSA